MRKKQQNRRFFRKSGSKNTWDWLELLIEARKKERLQKGACPFLKGFRFSGSRRREPCGDSSFLRVFPGFAGKPGEEVFAAEICNISQQNNAAILLQPAAAC